ncbi:MAG: hypothetical protein LBC98_00530 [Prevotellaceae bacterium]|nr:hypothetical protein [Prevotellaceae bacterium]
MAQTQAPSGWSGSLQYGYAIEMLDVISNELTKKPKHGDIISIEAGYRFKNGWYLGAYLGKSRVKYNHRDDPDSDPFNLFSGRKDMLVAQTYGVSCGRDFRLGKRSLFNLGFTGIFLAELDSEVHYDIINGDLQFLSRNQIWYDLGILLNFSYYYKINDNFHLGLKLTSMNCMVYFLQYTYLTPSLRFVIPGKSK